MTGDDFLAGIHAIWNSARNRLPWVRMPMGCPFRYQFRCRCSLLRRHCCGLPHGVLRKSKGRRRFAGTLWNCACASNFPLSSSWARLPFSLSLYFCHVSDLREILKDDHWAIAKGYILRWFVPDVISSVPLERFVCSTVRVWSLVMYDIWSFYTSVHGRGDILAIWKFCKTSMPAAIVRSMTDALLGNWNRKEKMIRATCASSKSCVLSSWFAFSGLTGCSASGKPWVWISGR